MNSKTSELIAHLMNKGLRLPPEALTAIDEFMDGVEATDQDEGGLGQFLGFPGETWTTREEEALLDANSRLAKIKNEFKKPGQAMFLDRGKSRDKKEFESGSLTWPETE